MALTNTNVVTRRDDDATINSTFIRIVGIEVEDLNENRSEVRIQFAFYKSKTKWEANFRKNAIKISGLDVNSLTFIYNRVNHGTDLQAHAYNKLKEHLMTVFPTWMSENLVISLPAPV